ncbi:hypothetical protein [Hyphomicrobium sp.]|uniref:hypothetical protein n=1 Tax=Hyphomicrobium sp. TaxID=82 RepID=UPI001D7B3BBD|nr:hypothetical protein [Hyphomicrobium sp.]MBY0559179.1 hypothetical protein [Hyphomicrobium sp.]
MSARITFVLSAVIAAATGGLSHFNRAEAEPLKAAVAVHQLRDAKPGWKISPASLVTNGAKSISAPVASETRRLDLSKLTMADFGDVEQSR